PSRAATFDRRWREAQGFLQQADALVRRPNAAPATPTLPGDAVLRGSLFTGCGSAERAIPNALATSRISYARQMLLVPFTTDGALCGDASAAKTLADEQ